MKPAVFGTRRRANASRPAAGSPEAALAPALVEGRWRVPGRFNFTRDVVESLAREPRRQALVSLGSDGVIETRTFHQLAQGAARWATLLRDAGAGPGDRVLVLEGTTPDWVESMLAILKVGAVAVPCSPILGSAALEIRIAACDARAVVATRRAEAELERLASCPPVLYVDEARRLASRLPSSAPTHDTAARDPALIVSTAGRSNGPRGVLHSHASTFAARAHAEHWLDAGLGDVVWCTARSDSPQALWSTLFGPWSRGAEVVLHDGSPDPRERLELVRRANVTVICQTPQEYLELAESGLLPRYRFARPRRLVSTGEPLPDDLVRSVEEAWGLTIHDGYGQAELGVFVGHAAASGLRAGSIGRPLPGYAVSVVDRAGHELPPGTAGHLAVRGRPPSLFTGYWNGRRETEAAFRGDWYLTGDVATRDDDGFLWLQGRAGIVRAVEPELAAPAEQELAAPAERPVDPEPVTRGLAEPTAPVVADRPAVAAAPVVHEPAPRAPAAPVAPAVPAGGEAPRERPVRPAKPLWARVTAAIWLLLVGMLVGGAAIPHAQDQPRVARAADGVPSAICVPKPPRR